MVKAIDKDISPKERCNYASIGVLGVAALVGIFLRTYLLADQVIIDDEWHGLYYVIGKSPQYLFTHFSIPGATCIPLNLYAWILLKTCGWSEVLLRLPSLVCGFLLLLAGPWLSREIIGWRSTVVLACLMTLSPLLIFYSRLCRPYSAVAVLGFGAILLAVHWKHSGEFRWGLLFALIGSLAIYFHLFAVVTVAAPFIAEFVLGLSRLCWKTQPDNRIGPPLRQWIIVAAMIAVLTSVLVLPALVHSLQSTFFKVAMAGSFDWHALPRLALLISGTGQPILATLFWAALLVGAVGQCRRNPWFGSMLLSLYPLHALALLASRPDSAQSAIMLVRYCIPLVPVSLLLVACGIQDLLEAMGKHFHLRPALQAATGSAFVVALGVAGPLAQCYVAPNNFTNHGAFQHRYKPIDWQKSFFSDFTPTGFPLITTIQIEEISPFYGFLAEHPTARPIVEYPMLIGDHFNPLYYYQHFHRRRVVVGYTRDMTLARGLAAGNIYGNTYIDQVLTLVPDPSRLRFRNLVDLDDLPAIRARGVQYVILHKQFEAQLPAVAPPPPALDRLWRKYHEAVGEPAYEDAHIAVFRF